MLFAGLFVSVNILAFTEFCVAARELNDLHVVKEIVFFYMSTN